MPSRPYRKLAVPAGGLKGANIAPSDAQIANGRASAHGSAWGQMFVDDDWSGPTGFGTQVDVARSMGCNCVRIILNGGSAYWAGAITQAQFAARLGRIMAYARSKGMLVYPAIGGQNEFQGYQSADGGDGTVTGFGAILAWARFVASAAARFDNLLGLDLCQEGYSVTFAGMEKAGATNLSEAQCASLLSQLYSAVRSVAPDVALGTSWTVPDYRLPLCNVDSDFVDFHCYPVNVPGGCGDFGLANLDGTLRAAGTHYAGVQPASPWAPFNRGRRRSS
jgi:hypothetical protein